MKVFISYGNIADQVTALRLQALAAVNGLTVFVPPAFTRQLPAALDEDVLEKLKQADVVLGLIETGLAESCHHELNAALEVGKKTMIMCSPAFAPSFESYFKSSLVIIDPANPTQASTDIVQHLKAMESERSAQKALVGIGLLALGLLIVATGDRS
jgi:hypothetical protein